MKSYLNIFLIIHLIAFVCTEDLSVFYKNFIKDKGYELEENSVQAQDGYILSLWHIKPNKSNGKVAFFQHGLSDTAWCFFQLEEKSLPFLLLKDGFEVWLGNTRGNVFSSKLNSQNGNDYDKYTIDDFVEYDLPAMINYAKSKTGGKKMSYIGHSQGTTIFIMLTMHNPSLIQSSFDHFATLGTVPNIAYTHFTPIEILDKIYGILKAVNIFDTLNLSDTQRNLIASFCKTSPGICGKFFDAGASIKPSNRMDYKKIYNFMYYYPGGVSKNNLLHWSQIHLMKKLVYYNPNFNKEKTATPYNINNLKEWRVRALISRTDDDTFSSYEDVTEFYNTVEYKSYVEILDLTNYGHIDVLAADSAYEDIYIPILNFVKN